MADGGRRVRERHARGPRADDADAQPFRGRDRVRFDGEFCFVARAAVGGAKHNAGASVRPLEGMALDAKKHAARSPS